MTTRLRKVSCECGYTIRVTRSWMSKGFPTCPCGQEMRPVDACDLAYCDLITQDDVPAPVWTQICRDNGWDDSIIRRGGAAKAFQRKYEQSGALAGRHAGAAHCAYAGCGRWIKADADRCSAGHQQHDHAAETSIPF